MPLNTSSKTSKLIQLCKDNGLIDGRVVPHQNHSAVQQTHSGSQPPGNNLLGLTKSVTELQKTVRDLKESVSQVKGHEQGSVYPSQGNFSTMNKPTTPVKQGWLALWRDSVLWQSKDLQTSMDSCSQGTFCYFTRFRNITRKWGISEYHSQYRIDRICENQIWICCWVVALCWDSASLIVSVPFPFGV